jgi:ABC-type glycerol-3-phosphate transport system permease component
MAFCLLPILWGVRTSLAPEYDSSLVPRRVTGEHYMKILGRGDFYRYAANSALVTLGALALVLPLALAAGYALERRQFWGRRLAPIILALPLLPAVAFLVPIAHYLNWAGLYNTRAALVLANAAFCLPFATWMVWNFVHAIPPCLEEAAFIDGCSRLGALVRVTLPSMIPGAIAAGVFVAIQTWSNYLFAYALTSDSELRVLPKAIVDFVGSWRTDWGGLMAIGVLTLLPPLVLFQLLQRWFVAGMYGLTER